MYFCRAVIFCTFGLLGLAGDALGATVLKLGAQDQRIDLGQHMEYIADQGGQLSVHEVHDLPGTAYSTPNDGVPSFGFTSARYWFRVGLSREASTDPTRILEIRYPPLDDISVYLINARGMIIEEAHGGDRVAFSDRPVSNRHFTAPLFIPENGQAWLYISIKTQSSLMLPAVLYSPVSFVEQSRDEQYFFGLYYGIMLSMLLFNLLIFLYTRDSIYALYVGYISSVALFQLTLNGFAFEYIWPTAPEWNNSLLPVSIFISFAGLVLMTRSFLQTRSLSKRLDNGLLSILGLVAVGAIASFFMPYNTAIQISTGWSVPMPVIIFAIALYAFARGQTQARFYLLAFTAQLIGMSAYALKTFQLLPHTFFTEYGLQFGAGVQIILLSFALADRMRILKEQAVRTERQANIELEKRVAERTAELDQAMRELESKNLILNHLNTVDPLTGVHNRLYMEEVLSADWPRCYRQRQPFSVLMIDIDCFKPINDSFGHQCGDEALKQVAKLIQQQIKRPGDVVCRYGGEEFMAILPGTPPEGAAQLAALVRRAVEKAEISTSAKQLKLTVSIGAAGMIPQSLSKDAVAALIAAADDALYRAKSGGRNRVVLAEALEPLSPATNT